MKRSVKQFFVLAAMSATAAATAPFAAAGPYQYAGSFATNPQLGLLPIPMASSSISEWASGATIVRGLRNVEDPTEYSSNPSDPSNFAYFGGVDGAYVSPSNHNTIAQPTDTGAYSTANAAPIGEPASTSSSYAVALGQNGTATLTFTTPIANGPGADFAVFGNGFSSGANLEWVKPAYVEVSSDGVNFFKFPSVSLTPTTSQVGSGSELDPTNLYDLAGKDPAGYGTPFDLSELTGVAGLNVNDVIAVRIVAISGDTDAGFQNLDSEGNVINAPYSAPSWVGSEGFDLAGVGVINEAPEPTTTALLFCGLMALGGRRTGERIGRRAAGTIQSGKFSKGECTCGI